MHPELFRIFGLPIKSYGLMLVIGFALAIWRAVRISKKRYGIDPSRVYDIALIALFAGVIGARLVYVILDRVPWDEFIRVWDGGLSFHGGLAAAFLCGGIYTWRARISFWDAADMAMPSLAIAYACTRIGCFINGCCYGAPTHLPWAVRFLEHEVGGRRYYTPPSHPTQIYAALANLLIFFLLVKIERARMPRGFATAAYMGLYGVYRLLIEFLRAGYTAEYWRFGLTQAQAVSIVMVVGSAVAVAVLGHRPRVESE